MITIEDGDDDRVVIASASGHVTADDYETTLIPAVDAAAVDGAVRMLYALGPDFEGYDAEAAMDDMRLGMHHWRDFERIAVISDQESWRVAVRAFGFLMPGAVRVFGPEDEDEARAWITAE